MKGAKGIVPRNEKKKKKKKKPPIGTGHVVPQTTVSIFLPSLVSFSAFSSMRSFTTVNLSYPCNEEEEESPKWALWALHTWSPRPPSPFFLPSLTRCLLCLSLRSLACGHLSLLTSIILVVLSHQTLSLSSSPFPAISLSLSPPNSFSSVLMVAVMQSGLPGHLRPAPIISWTLEDIKGAWATSFHCETQPFVRV